MTPDRAAIRGEARRLAALFADAGAETVETDILQPADTLLDLYGEDIRARAYVTSDPVRGEQMLRPDFTVPLVLLHRTRGERAARYTYCGEVFRRQEYDTGRASEYVQIGFEIFDDSDPAAADAEVFALISEALHPARLRAATGDIGILLAAIGGLSASDRRKAALRRHVWRPRRFRRLLDRFGGRVSPPPGRDALLAERDPMARATPMIGLRSAGEIAARIETLRGDAAEPPIPTAEADLLDDILALKDRAPAALERLRDMVVDLPAILPAVDRMERRLDALASRGIDIGRLDFEASYGRTSMEYYDGFVFGFYSEARPDLPPVATGGRYDALVRALAGSDATPAVGGVVRPDLLLRAAQEGP